MPFWRWVAAGAALGAMVCGLWRSPSWSGFWTYVSGAFIALVVILG